MTTRSDHIANGLNAGLAAGTVIDFAAYRTKHPPRQAYHPDDDETDYVEVLVFTASNSDYDPGPQGVA
jgi:hypothetical protein